MPVTIRYVAGDDVIAVYDGGYMLYFLRISVGPGDVSSS